uniref:EF-hand domain-containing protein n=1 Tax=Cyclophora tenuis TaxID=216820 RepID=A0A7S1D3Z8_CYCTE|mmetsp:Transcript_20610/g.35161  ORF Transcript_20610/g.35161 Transcript_20610/m.35161 type:complete len:407 (+) Transcript_20610:67-1287(+)
MAVDYDSIPEEELQAMKDCFALFDTNKDGMIDAEELQAGFEEFGQKRRRSSIIRMIDQADKDDNQKVDFEEFVLLMKEAEMDGTVERAMATTKSPEEVDAEQAEKELRKRLNRPNLTRDDINASIYGNLSGVRVSETPELISSKIRMFDEEISQIKEGKKKAFLIAMEKNPDKIDDKHKLMFLRAELFNSKKAAARCCRHWDFLLDIFGPEKAFLPMTQKGALRDDLETLKVPFYNDTGVKDAYGQHMMFIDFRSNDTTKYDYRAICRCVMYVLWNRLEGDEEVQMNGMVVQVFSPQSPRTWNAKISRNVLLYLRYGAPVRLASIHGLHPTRLFKTMFRLARIMAGELGSRIKIFGGSTEEVFAKLKAAGIDKDKVAEKAGGTLVLDREKYLRERLAVEEEEEKKL